MIYTVYIYKAPGGGGGEGLQFLLERALNCACCVRVYAALIIVALSLSSLLLVLQCSSLHLFNQLTNAKFSHTTAARCLQDCLNQGVFCSASKGRFFFLTFFLIKKVGGNRVPPESERTWERNGPERNGTTFLWNGSDRNGKPPAK